MQATQHLVYSRHAEGIRAAEAKGNPLPPTVVIFDPPCDCAECQLSYRDRSVQRIDTFRYAGSLSKSQAQEILDGFISQITEDRRYLKAAVEKYGDTILNDWRTKSQLSRAALLLEVNPALPKKYPARVHLEYANTMASEHQEKHRQTNLLPYLDVQTLSKHPAPVIGLLEQRTQRSPEEFVPFDQQQLMLAWAAGLFQVQFNKDAVKVFGCQYGQLVPWDAAAIHRGDLVGFPRARLLLEAQALIMSFLRKIVTTILAKSKKKHISGTIEWRQFIHTGMGRPAERYWSDFAFNAFSNPPTFDVDDLLARAKTRLNATADHLELLQTEPAYIRRYASIIGKMQSVARDHQYSVVVERGSAGEIIATPSDAGRWSGSKTISDEIIGDLEVHFSWIYTHEELEHVRDAYHRHRHHISRGEPLPKEVDDALASLELLLVNAAHLRSMQLQAIISQRPGFKRWYEHQSYNGENRTGYKLRCSGEDTAGIFRKDPLWWCIMQLQGDPEDHTRFPYSTLFEFLDAHLASANPKERSRLDEILYDKLSDYATIVYMLQTVRMHQPKCSIRNLDEVVKVEDRLAWRRFKAKKVDDLETTLPGLCMKTLMEVPFPKGPRNVKWLENWNDTHTALQGYWKSVHEHYTSLNRGREYSQKDNEILTKPIEHWSSDQYRNLLAAKKESILKEISLTKRAKLPNNDTFLPLFKDPRNKTFSPRSKVSVDTTFVPLPSGPDLPSRPALPELKVKEKTRGYTDILPSPMTDASTPDEVQPVTVLLNKRSMKTFSCVFPLSHEERGRTIPWDTFVSSMEDAGFKAHSGGGSIVIFENMKGGGKINFHRPHPDPTLDPVILQTIGRRMNKWFGWTRDVFKLAAN